MAIATIKAAKVARRKGCWSSQPACPWPWGGKPQLFDRDARERRKAGLVQAAHYGRIQLAHPLIEVARNALCNVEFVHNVMPLAESRDDSLWTAREQWVLTLPSEQPMAAAVSATSSSSQ